MTVLAARSARAALFVLWYCAIPALLAANVYRYLLARAFPSADATLLGLKLGTEQRLFVALLAFAVFVSLVHYWRYSLPGGRYLSPLPLALAARIRRERIAEYSGAENLRSWVNKPRVRRRLERVLGSGKQAEIESLSAQLSKALDENRPKGVAAAHHALAGLVGGGARTARLIHAGVLAATLLAIVTAGYQLRKATIQPYQVSGYSMLSSLKPGDEVLVNKLAFRRSVPKRGDLVFFDKLPGMATLDDGLRRVIGLPGDRIEMNRGGFPMINGWEVPSCDVGRYFRWGSQGETNGRVRLEFLEDRVYLALHVPGARAFAPYVVAPGEVFVLADNRNRTLDSRNWSAGETSGVPLGSILGRVDMILTAANQNGEIDESVLFRAPGMQLNLHGLDVSGLLSGIAICLRNRPASTYPPPPGAPLLKLSGAEAQHKVSAP